MLPFKNQRFLRFPEGVKKKQLDINRSFQNDEKFGKHASVILMFVNIRLRKHSYRSDTQVVASFKIKYGKIK